MMADNPDHYTYLLLSESTGQYYIGYTSDLVGRVLTHQADEGNWTRGKGPWRLVYYETFVTDTEARKREIKLKRMKSKVYLKWLSQNGPGTSVG